MGARPHHPVNLWRSSRYSERCQTMMQTLEEHMPAGTRWTKPEGGLFLWVELPGGLQADDLFADALREKVAFVPGSPFYARNPQHAFMRLNYSNRSPDFIREGIERLGRVIQSRLGA